MPNVPLMEQELFANVLEVILEIHSQDADWNHVKVVLVEPMPNVLQMEQELCANVLEDTLEIHLQDADWSHVKTALVE